MPVYRRANRQYVAMTETELWRFLKSQRKVYVGFTMRDGYPHVSPIWFCVMNGRIYMRTHDYKVKTALARTGKACCVIDAGDKYKQLRGVIVWGKSRVVSDKRLIDTVEQILNRKYEKQQWKQSEMPDEWVRARREERRAYIELVPEKLSSWDNRKI